MVLVYLIVFGLGFTSFAVVMSGAKNPENVITGNWQEVSWEYEKVDAPELKSDIRKGFNENIKKTMASDLVIHEAETWKFLPNGELILSGGETEKKVHWRIKGRGHILQLKYDGDMVENYNLTELDDDHLVLNFESDVQARGIAKLTFKKIN